MDDYRNSIEGFDPSTKAATSENLSPYAKLPSQIQEYSDTPQETITESEITDTKEEYGSYMLPKKVIVKTYKLKII